jgi:predicted RNA methylase
MARLASQASAGFYPTPPRVVTAIARHLAATAERAGPPPGRRGGRTIRLLDPCAGTGEAAAAIAAVLGAESFGIELNEQRADACRSRLDRVLATSAFSVRLANGAFSCLWLNAPYDCAPRHAA